MNLKPFGEGKSAREGGYSLSFLIGWLEALARDEEENLSPTRFRGPKFKRHELVTEAIELLYQAAAMSTEEDS